MERRCSQCGNSGHNSRTCTHHKVGGDSNNVVNGLRLFGVQVDLSSPSSSPYCSSPPSSIDMKKSLSMDCLPYSSPASSSSSLTLSRASISENSKKVSAGYLSDGLRYHPQERKKGVPWSEEEHEAFLAGLEKLGKGDWRGISRHFVTTRTSTQVASHAQKYFLRKTTLSGKKRRSSLFDMALSDKMDFSNTKIIDSYLEGNTQNHQGSDFSQSPSPTTAATIGLFGPFPSMVADSLPAVTSPTNTIPDLELTLGVQRPRGRAKSPTNALLVGSVT